MYPAVSMHRDREQTQYDLIEARSEARDGEYKRDLNREVDHVNDRSARKTRWPTMAVRPQDMPKRIVAIEARDVQSWMESFHPWSNSAHSKVALMRIRPFGLS